MLVAPPKSPNSCAPELLHRDDRLCVVTKPAGVAVHRGWAVAEHYLLDLVRDLTNAWLFPVHRLDQPTSGCVVFAFDREAARDLSDQFAAHQVFKRYVALVRGPASATSDLIDHALSDPDAPAAPPREAQTRIRGMTRGPGRYDLVEAIPLTGRTHQIRRHLKHRSLHIIGDVRYGKGEHNRHFRDTHGLSRLALHALDLAFRHPDDGRLVAFRAPLTADLASPLTHAGIPHEGAIAALTPALQLALQQIEGPPHGTTPQL